MDFFRNYDSRQFKVHTAEDVDKIVLYVDEVFSVLKNGIEKNEIEQLLKAPVRQTGFRRLA